MTGRLDVSAGGRTWWLLAALFVGVPVGGGLAWGLYYALDEFVLHLYVLRTHALPANTLPVYELRVHAFEPAAHLGRATDAAAFTTKELFARP